ncbi:hypothetical protein [Rothia sp. P4278]|uniref:hypothetical protein n=1 Tax=Rothia sp. P4278 TaxID=3402658 RepID=UPI003ADF7D05
MAQEIADLANKQAALIQQIQHLEGIIQASGGLEALNLTRYITEARNELSHTKQVNAELIASTQRRAQEILEGAQQSVHKQQAELKKEVMAEAQPVIEAEIAKQVEIREGILKEQVEKEAEKIFAEVKESALNAVNIDEIALANQEAARILDEARAQTFTEAARTWKQGHENWKRVHDQSQFIPSPISTASLELVEVLQEIGAFDAGERRLKLASDYGTRTLSRGKKEAIEPIAQLLGRPAPGESINQVVEVRLVGQRQTLSAPGPDEKYVFAYHKGCFLGGLTNSYASRILPFLEAMDALGISVYGEADIKLSATKAKGILQTKSSIGVPSVHAIRDSMPKIYRLARTMNSAYAQNIRTAHEAVEWVDRFGSLSLEIRESQSYVRDCERELRILEQEGGQEQLVREYWMQKLGVSR